MCGVVLMTTKMCYKCGKGVLTDFMKDMGSFTQRHWKCTNCKREFKQVKSANMSSLISICAS